MTFDKIRNFFSKAGVKKLPSKSQWRQILKVLTRKEKIVFFIFLVLFLSSLTFLLLNFYFKNTEKEPCLGGSYSEGLVGYPRFINPIYGAAFDIDRDLIELLFSGLFKYNEKGEIVPDLAREYKIEEEGKVYEITLKENIFWSDGSPVTADDVVFTIETIQNQDFKSPQRGNWAGVEVERISENQIRFHLKNPSAPFLENLTLKIIPKHIWKNISSQNFPLSIYNLKPIGSGPYKLKELKQDNSGKISYLTLNLNSNYHGKKPFLPEITFRFFEKEEDLIKAAKNGEIKGLTLGSIKNLSFFLTDFNLYSLPLPRYFAVFFNPDKSKIFAEKEIRLALNYGTNKNEILEKLLLGYAKIVESPILPEVFGFQIPAFKYEFDLEKAKEILEKAGFVEGPDGKREKTIKKTAQLLFKSDLRIGSQGQEVKELQKCLAKDSKIYPEGEVTGLFGELTKKAVIKFQEKYREEILEPLLLKEGTGLVTKNTRKKLNEVCLEIPEEKFLLKFSLSTVDQPILIELSNFLKEQWENLGAEVEIKTFGTSELSRNIKDRNYESLLFGEVLGLIPDPFPFWHSSQKKDPGLNLAIYQNKKADKLLEEARQTLDPGQRAQKYQDFQNLVIEDAPVVFLYSPDYLYLVSKEIKGMAGKIIADPSQRFNDIENWYIKTKRAWK